MTWEKKRTASNVSRQQLMFGIGLFFLVSPHPFYALVLVMKRW
jgi:hypothetical protein